MAGNDALVTYGGQANLSGASDALWLKVFGGEVLTAFMETTQFMDRSTVRSISSGKSAQFPNSWKGTAEYAIPGVELLGTQVGMNERVIVIDDELVADRFVSKIDEAKEHWDVRADLSRDIGMTLARTMDQHIAQVGVLAARTAANITGASGGSQVTMNDNLAAYTADEIVAAIFSAATALDQKYVPAEDRFVFVRPLDYYALVNSSSKAIHFDYNKDSVNGGVGSGKIAYVAGIPIVKTNNLPSTNIVTGPTTYQGDFTRTIALVSHKSAVGTVKLIDLAMEMIPQPWKRGTLLLGSFAVGHGVLRPESAVEILAHT